EVFYMTEALASLEGLEKGPAGNTALAAAFSLAQEMDQDQMIVVQETEYTGAGKHIQPQLSFARENGIEIKFGNPKDEVAGKNIILPSHPSLIKAEDADLNHMRKSLIKNALANYSVKPTAEDIAFLAEETNTDVEFVKNILASM
ncbi:MAG: PLP-dependent lyase/thiolase, partial [Sedimentibacter sp.]|nr:PLP-dependent lyase/thiolase [Sedimentibacter sp.]